MAIDVEGQVAQGDRQDLKGKRALVTGAAVGIGQAIAVELARRGARVIVHHAGSDPAETLSTMAAAGSPGSSIQADLANAEECERVVLETSEQLGGLDLLVNNAGISLEEPIEVMGAAEFDKIFNVNVKSAYLLTRAAVSPLAADGGGSIVNISSAAAFAGIPPGVLYAATKGAINAMTRTLAIELIEKRIRVNAVAPGLVEVPRYFTQNRAVPYDTEVGASIVPWGRVGRPEDISSLVAFLLSEPADFITGQVIYADGGTTSKLAVS